jgi:ketosteroid isomerase-like protein
VKRLAAIATALALTACLHVDVDVSGAEAGEVSSAATHELDAANTGFSAAWLAGDIEAIMAAYTQDAVVHPPAGGVLTTREQVRGVWAPIASWNRAGHRLEPTLRQRLSGGEVLEMGRWHSARLDDSGAATWVSGCYTVIWREDGGHWRMRYDSWTAPNDESWACRPR